MITVNNKDWLAVGEKFFGTDKKKWKFKCPICGNAQSIEDFEKLGMSAKEAANYVYFSCIGRWSKGKVGTMTKKSKPCDYTLGGLFKLGELEVIGEDGSKGQVFVFANDNAMMELEKVSFKDPLEEMEKICQVGTLWICKKEFEVESRHEDSYPNRTIKVGEIMEFRYPYPINFRTIEDLYYSCNERVFLMNSDYYGKILEDIRFGNRHTLKQILDEKLFEPNQMVLWHCTRLEYMENILKKGIKTKNPEQRENKPKGVYLSEYQFNWMWNTQREGRIKGAVLQIDVTGLPLIEDFHADMRDTQNNSKCIGKDFICLVDIPPERIKAIWVETETNTFQPLDLNEIKMRSGV